MTSGSAGRRRLCRLVFSFPVAIRGSRAEVVGAVEEPAQTRAVPKSCLRVAALGGRVRLYKCGRGPFLVPVEPALTLNILAGTSPPPSLRVPW